MKLSHSVVFCVYILHYSTESLQFCDKNIYEGELYTKIKSVVAKIDVLAIWSPVRTGLYEIAELCSNKTGRSVQRRCHSGETTAIWDDTTKGLELLDCRLIPNKCLAESFEHLYVRRRLYKNKWPTTKIGEIAKPVDMCLLETGLPMTRKCLFNGTVHQATWEDKDYKNIKCLKDYQQNTVTNDLNKLYKNIQIENNNNNGKNSMDAITELTNILKKEHTIRIASDLEISANILQVITSANPEPQLAPKILEATDILMQSNDMAVELSYELDAPINLLNTIEKYLDNVATDLVSTVECSQNGRGVYNITRNFTSVFYMNPKCSNISGVAIYSKGVRATPSMLYDANTNTYIRYLYLNETLDNVTSDPDLEVASYFPQEVWKALVEKDQGSSKLDVVRFSLYRNKNFFLDRRNKEQFPTSVVLKISIPNYTGK